MSRITGRRTSYGHRVQRIERDHFRLSWVCDYKVAGSRLRFPRTTTRDTDRAGAERFARRWKIAMPAEPQQ